MPFLIANSFAFSAATAFSPATPPVFAIAATFNPTFTIFPIRFNFFLKRTRCSGVLWSDTIYFGNCSLLG